MQITPGNFIARTELIMNNRNRTKNHCPTEFFSSQHMLASAHDQVLESACSKRFTRKKEFTSNHTKSMMLNPTDENKGNEMTERKSFGGECKKNQGLSHTFVKTEDLLFNIALTPAKNRVVAPQMSSDRAQVQIHQKNVNQTERLSKVKALPVKKMKVDELTAELQLRNNDVQILSQQNQALRCRLQSRQEQFQKEKKKIQKICDVKINKCNLQIQNLSEELRIKGNQLLLKNEQIAIVQSKYQKLLTELSTVVNGQKSLQQQVDDLRKNCMPKELKDLVSFRERSLMRQVEELKKQLKESTNENEKQLEREMLKLKQDYDVSHQKYRELSIYNRVLQRKISEKDKQMKVKSIQFGRSYSKIKDSHNEVMDKLKQAKKENTKLKRLHTIHNSPCKRLNTSPESTSLDLSLSSSRSP